MSPEFSWRPMRVADLAAVAPLGNAIHQDHPEDPAVFAERFALCPEGCFALDGAAGLAGYVISHPWVPGAPPALNTLLGALPAAARNWYIHDLALHAAARGSGAGAEIVARLAQLAAARGMASMSLIAVGRSPGFWARQGFHPATLAGSKLASYGAMAAFMTRGLVRK